MKRAIGLVLFVLAGSVAAQSSHYRSGYTTRSGTYVAPSYATNPNGTLLDNYSTKGNVNPYTGRAGTVDPYRVAPSRSLSDGYTRRSSDDFRSSLDRPALRSSLLDD